MKFRSRSKASRGKNSDRKAGEVGGQPNSPPSCTLVHPLRKRFPLDLEIPRGPPNHHLRTPNHHPTFYASAKKTGLPRSPHHLLLCFQGIPWNEPPALPKAHRGRENPVHRARRGETASPDWWLLRRISLRPRLPYNRRRFVEEYLLPHYSTIHDFQ